jgi:O-antigen/teichoic acid export membrane protein
VTDQLITGAPPAGPATEHPLGRLAGRTMVWSQVAKTAEGLISLAIAVAAVRALNPNAFGLYSLLTYLAGSLSVFIPVVLVEALAGVLPRFRDPRERLSLCAVVAGLRIAVIASCVALLIPSWGSFRGLFGLEPISIKVFLVAAVYWAAQDLLAAVSAYYVVELDARPLAFWKPLGQLITLAAIIAVAATEDRWSSSVGEVLAAVAFGYVVSIVGLLAGLRRVGSPRRPSANAVRTVLSYTRNTWPIGVLAFGLSTHVDVLLIGAIDGRTQEVAYYVAAFGIVVRAQMFLLTGWVAPTTPALSRARLDGGAFAMARAWELFAKLWLFVALPITVLLLILADPLVVTLFGQEYEPARGLLKWAAAFYLVVCLACGPLGMNTLWALDRQSVVTRIKLVTTVANLALAVVLIDRYAALGAVIATGGAMAATSLIELVYARRLGGLRYPARFAARVLGATAAAAVPALAVRPQGALGLLLCGTAGFVVYLAFSTFLRPFGLYDLEALRRASPRLAASPLRLLFRA